MHSVIDLGDDTTWSNQKDDGENKTIHKSMPQRCNLTGLWYSTINWHYIQILAYWNSPLNYYQSSFVIDMFCGFLLEHLLRSVLFLLLSYFTDLRWWTSLETELHHIRTSTLTCVKPFNFSRVFLFFCNGLSSNNRRSWTVATWRNLYNFFLRFLM